MKAILNKNGFTKEINIKDVGEIPIIILYHDIDEPIPVHNGKFNADIVVEMKRTVFELQATSTIPVSNGNNWNVEKVALYNYKPIDNGK